METQPSLASEGREIRDNLIITAYINNIPQYRNSLKMEDIRAPRLTPGSFAELNSETLLISYPIPSNWLFQFGFTMLLPIS
jgi:hypothetical protein